MHAALEEIEQGVPASLLMRLNCLGQVVVWRQLSTVTNCQRVTYCQRVDKSTSV